jgi:protein-histidine pros-kinase
MAIVRPSSGSGHYRLRTTIQDSVWCSLRSLTFCPSPCVTIAFTLGSAIDDCTSEVEAVIHASKRYIGHPRFRPGSLQAYLVAGLIAALATALHLTLEQWLAGTPFATFWPAAIAATFLCGSAAGLVAALLSLLSAWLFILPSDITQILAYQTAGFTVGSLTIVAVIGMMRATTAEIRRSNEILRVSEAKFRSLLESAPDAMVIVDERQTIALINAQTEDLFGYNRSELLGKPISVLLPEAVRESYAQELGAFMVGPAAAPSRRVLDLEGVRSDGAEFPIEISLGPLKTESGILVANAIRDVTERVQTEARLIEASKAKSNFLAGMSHELRTPLNAIIGFSEMIRDAVIGPLDARYRGYGGDINASGRHLQTIINDILDIAKVESGRLELREEIVSIGETIEACRRIVTAMAETAGVTLLVDVPGALPLIRSDRVRFQQILLNLMSNAVKFTPSGGRVSVSAAVHPQGAVIAVADTGIGMKQEDIPIALEPFRQIEGVMSRRFDGTGLGLPLAKALVELHGGSLDVESAPDVGTTVRVRLPAERIANEAA